MIQRSPDHLGQEFFRFEIATAVAGAVIGINPFDQPDVEASKVKTRELTAAFEKAGAFYSFRGERIGQGRDKASAYVAEHPEIAEEVRRLLLEARKAENAALGAPVAPHPVQAQAA